MGKFYWAASVVTILLLTAPARAREETRRIPDHPDDIQTPSTQWQIPDADSLRHVFPRGLKAYTLADHQAPVVHFNIFVARGWIHDPPARQGLMELTCRSMTAGGTSLWSPGDLQRELELLGIEFKVHVAPEYTVIQTVYPASNLRPAMGLLAAILYSPTFLGSGVASVRETLVRNCADGGRLPYGNASARALRLSLGMDDREVEGYRKMLSSMDRKALKACHRSAFRSSRTVLAVSGDFDPETLMELLETKFDKPERNTAEPLPVNLGNPRTGVHLLPSSSPLACAVVSKRVPHLQSNQYLSWVIAATLLADLHPSRILEEPSSPTTPPAFETAGTVLGLQGNRGVLRLLLLGPARDLPVLLRRMVRTLRRLADAPLAPTELARAQSVLLSRAHDQFRSPRRTCDTFASLEVRGIPRNHYHMTAARLMTTNDEDVRRAATLLLPLKTATLVVTGDPTRIAEGEMESGVKLSGFGKLTIYDK